MKSIILSGKIPGLLAYAVTTIDPEKPIPIGWISVAPREEFSRLERSRILKKVDDQPVWSIVCFFVAKNFRNQGVTIYLLKAAVNFAKQNGAIIVEGYPIQPKKDRSPDAFVYSGLTSTFLKAGFKEVLRRSETRPIMRYYL